MGAQGIGDDGCCLLLVDCHWNGNMPASVEVVGEEKIWIERPRKLHAASELLRICSYHLLQLLLSMSSVCNHTLH